MSEESTGYSDAKAPQALYAEACRLARSPQESELAALRDRLTDPSFLSALDEEEAYEGPPERLCVAGVLQILAENHSEAARRLLIGLTAEPVFLAHHARTELLILALIPLRPASPQAVEFWEKHFQPEDGYTAVTFWAILANGSPPAVALFERKMLNTAFAEDERRYWLTTGVLQHRNDPPLLEACARLFESDLETPFRHLLVDVLFDYQPEEWYGPGHRFKPPPRHEASPEALVLLRSIAKKALADRNLPEHQKKQVRQTLQELDSYSPHSVALQGPRAQCAPEGASRSAPTNQRQQVG